jgi:hypothetical protein
MRLVIQLGVIGAVLVLVAASVQAGLVPSLRVYADDDPNCLGKPVRELILPQSCTAEGDGFFGYYACAPTGHYVSEPVLIHNRTLETGDRSCSRLYPYPEEYTANVCKQDREEASVIYVCSNSGTSLSVTAWIIGAVAMLTLVRM